MSNNKLDLTSKERYVSNLFYGVPKFSHKNSVTYKVLISVQKYWFKLILRSIFKFPKVLKT